MGHQTLEHEKTRDASSLKMARITGASCSLITELRIHSCAAQHPRQVPPAMHASGRWQLRSKQTCAAIASVCIVPKSSSSSSNASSICAIASGMSNATSAQSVCFPKLNRTCTRSFSSNRLSSSLDENVSGSSPCSRCSCQRLLWSRFMRQRHTPATTPGNCSMSQPQPQETLGKATAITCGTPSIRF